MEWGRVAGFALAAGASLLAGCAADSPILEQLMVVPGYYDAKARSTQKHAEEAAVRKRCDLNAEPGNPATGPEAVKSLR